MTDKARKKLERHREQRAIAAGGGAWVRIADRALVLVEVQFYPRVSLWITSPGERRQATLAELQRDCERLRL